MLTLAAALAAAFTLQHQGNTTWFVDDDGTAPGSGTIGDPYVRLQGALASPTTVPGDTILVLPGTYAERIDFLGKDVRVHSTLGAAATVIDAGQVGSVVTFSSGEGAGAQLIGFTLTNGRGTSYGPGTAGGGVFCAGSSPTIRDCVIQRNTAQLGGGVACIAAGPALEGCSIVRNVARAHPATLLGGSGGGLYVESWIGSAPLSIARCLVVSNAAESDGGGLASVASDVLAVDSVFERNEARDVATPQPVGGAVSAQGAPGTLVASGCTFRDNRVVGFLSLGGGLALLGAAELDGCLVADNDAGDSNVPGSGGGIALGPGASVRNSTVRNNRGEWGGGGISGSGVVQNCLVERNCSSTGGGIECTGAMRIEDSTIRENFGCSTATQDFGAGVYGPATLVRCTIEGNQLAGEGGGTHGADLVDCTVRGNLTVASVGYSALGGGAFGGSLTRCQVYDNEVLGRLFSPLPSGAGAYGATLTECLVHHNRALPSPAGPPSAGGGLAACAAARCAIYSNEANLGAGSSGSALERCTVIGNRMDGVRGGASVHDSIVRGNHGAQIAGNPQVGYSNVEGGFAGTGNLDAQELFWAPLGGPGGEGHDFHLRAGSPGVDAGDPASALDLNGTRADLGAFPFDAAWCPVPFAYCSAKVNSQGCVPEIWSTGLPRLDPSNQFRVRARNVVNHKSGMLLWSRMPAALPFQGGSLCAGAPLVHTLVQDSAGNPPPDDCSGTYAVHLSHSYLLTQGFAPGDSAFAQYWSRDPAHPIGSSGLTDALWFVVGP